MFLFFKQIYTTGTSMNTMIVSKVCLVSPFEINIGHIIVILMFWFKKAFLADGSYFFLFKSLFDSDTASCILFLDK